MTQTQVQELSDAQRELEDARREKAQLDERIEALEARVRDGDQQEAVEELGRQWAARRAAELRQEAAERQLQEAQTAEWERQLREKVAAAEADLMQLTPAHFGPVFEEAVGALEKLTAMGTAYQETVERHARALVEAGESEHVILHQPGVFTALRFGRHEFRTGDSSMAPDALLRLVQDERVRRAQIPGRLAKGLTPPKPLGHPVTSRLAEQQEQQSEGM